MIDSNLRKPCYAVIFSSQRTEIEEGYADMAGQMLELAAKQEGFLAVESVREPNGPGLTVSYWQDLEAIRRWKQNTEHLAAQQLGREKWYTSYRVRICKIEREYEFEAVTKE